MPDIQGQSPPWERAGCTPGAWFRLFDRLTADWITAAQVVRRLYPSPGHPEVSVEAAAEIRRKADVVSDLHADWQSAIDGEGPTIRSLLQRYRIDPTADHADRQ